MTRTNWNPTLSEQSRVIRKWDKTKTARQLSVILNLKIWQVYRLAKTYSHLEFKREFPASLSDAGIRRRWRKTLTAKQNALYFGFSLTWAYKTKERLGLECAEQDTDTAVRKLAQTGRRGFRLAIPPSWLEEKGWQVGDDLKLTNGRGKIIIERHNAKKDKKTLDK